MNYVQLQDRLKDAESQLKRQAFNFIEKYIIFKAGGALGPVPDNACIHIQDSWYQKYCGNLIHTTNIQGQPVFTLSLMTKNGQSNLSEIILFFDANENPYWIILCSENWGWGQNPLTDELIWTKNEDEGEFPFDKTVKGLKFDWYESEDTCNIYLTIGDTKIVMYERRGGMQG